MVERGGHRLSAEVFNLTRNVVIGGTRRGRAHVMFMHASQQRISHVRIEHVGPRQADKKTGKPFPVPGRYGLHFHHCGKSSRGTLAEGIVIAHSGNRAFVPHASHGITLRDCVAYDVGQHAYWWDPDDRSTNGANASKDTLYDHCAAFKISPKTTRDRGPAEYRLSSFFLGQGRQIGRSTASPSACRTSPTCRPPDIPGGRRPT